MYFLNMQVLTALFAMNALLDIRNALNDFLWHIPPNILSLVIRVGDHLGNWVRFSVAEKSIYSISANEGRADNAEQWRTRRRGLLLLPSMGD